MVVLIMGLMAGLISVLVQADQRGLLHVESQRLAQLLDLAAAEARVSGASVAWIATASTYYFEHMTADRGWQTVETNDFLRARVLPSGMTVSALQLENTPLNSPWRIEFPAYGQTSAFTVTLQNGSAYSEVSVSPVGIVNVVVFAGDNRDET